MTLEKPNGIDPDIAALILVAIGVIVALFSPRNHDVALTVIGMGGIAFKGQHGAQG